LYGAGGSGASGTSNNGGSGRQGLIIITYGPPPSSFLTMF
jgi:hypothetical protein